MKTSTLTMAQKSLVRSYMLPSLAVGFDSSFVQFVMAQREEEVQDAELHGYPFPSIYVTRNVTQLQLLKALKVLGVEISILHGEKDPVISLNNSRALSSALGGVPVKVMHCGHCPHEEDPNTFLKYLRPTFS